MGGDQLIRPAQIHGVATQGNSRDWNSAGAAPRVVSEHLKGEILGLTRMLCFAGSPAKDAPR